MYNFDQMSDSEIESLVEQRSKVDPFSLDELIEIARYSKKAGRNQLYVILLRFLGGLGVLENIKSRLEDKVDKTLAETIFSPEVMPPIGTPLKEMPEYTSKLMERLNESLPLDDLKVVLAGNNHDIPREPFIKEREIYEQMDSLAAYLKDFHHRQVEKLQEHCDNGTVWFEQIITQPVVDYVASNQEIQSAVLKDNKLYITKIPYEPDAYLKTDDPKLKAYYACHCPFAREAILSDKKMDANWCYCSAGFVKHHFEVMFDRPLNVTVLENALNHDPICRFEIDLEGVPYK